MCFVFIKDCYVGDNKSVGCKSITIFGNNEKDWQRTCEGKNFIADSMNLPT